MCFIKLPLSKSPPMGPGDDNLHQDARMSSKCRELIDSTSILSLEWRRNGPGLDTFVDFRGQSSPVSLPS